MVEAPLVHRGAVGFVRGTSAWERPARVGEHKVPSARSRSVRAAVLDDGPDGSGWPGAGSPRWTPVFAITSPRPLTGKTFLARLLIDFLRVDGARVRAFDLNPSGDALHDFLPTLTQKAEIASTPGQMALFDRLVVADAVAKVVDLGHAQFEQFFGVVEEIGLVRELNQRGIELVIIYPADPHPASLDHYHGLMGRFPRTVVVPVLNDAIAKSRKLRDLYPIARAAAVPLQIPLLAPALKQYTEGRPHPFAEFHGQVPRTVPAQYTYELRAWTRRVFLEFRELELRLLLERLQASLR
jgi:hypothetical protein